MHVHTLTHANTHTECLADSPVYTHVYLQLCLATSIDRRKREKEVTALTYAMRDKKQEAGQESRAVTFWRSGKFVEIRSCQGSPNYTCPLGFSIFTDTRTPPHPQHTLSLLWELPIWSNHWPFKALLNASWDREWKRHRCPGLDGALTSHWVVGYFLILLVNVSPGVPNMQMTEVQVTLLITQHGFRGPGCCWSLLLGRDFPNGSCEQRTDRSEG